MGLPTPLLKILGSGIIACFLAAQITAVVIPVESYYWPFTDYPMYDVPHFEGDVVKPSHSIIGIYSEGQEEVTTPQDFGLTIFQQEWWFVPSLRDNRDRQRVQVYLDHLQASRTPPFDKLRIELQPYIISQNGFSPAPAEVIKVIDLNRQQEGNQ